jgi:hypothetical protein
VHIFGGWGTKRQHYKHAIDIYTANKFEIFFYENKRMNLLIPDKYNKVVSKAIHNDNRCEIIHSNSSAFWSAVSCHKQSTNNKLFIIEAGPLETNTDRFIDTFERIYKMPCPPLLRNNTDNIMKILGIPSTNVNPEWSVQLLKDIRNIKNYVNITSKKDAVIDNEYIDFIINNIKTNNNLAERYIFESGSHHNVSNSDTNRYKDIIQSHIDKIVF